MSKTTYTPQKCECCGQTATYVLAIDRGTVDIVKAISVAIRRKGINVIHPRKEMECTGKKLSYQDMVQNGQLTSNQVGNLSRARFHGLIAAVRGHAGSYCLTTKGAQFLKGASVPKFAIISKSDGRQIGYWEEEKNQCTIRDFTPDTEYWEGINFSVMDWRIVVDVPPRQREMATLFD